MSDLYVLDAAGEPVREPDVIRWAKRFESGERRVALAELPGGVRVSTVFLGIDHNFSGGGPPLLYETMVFGGPHAFWQDRHASRVAALDAHARVAGNLLAGLAPDEEEGSRGHAN